VIDEGSNMWQSPSATPLRKVATARLLRAGMKSSDGETIGKHVNPQTRERKERVRDECRPWVGDLASDHEAAARGWLPVGSPGA
jgi:hypothetical protein